VMIKIRSGCLPNCSRFCLNPMFFSFNSVLLPIWVEDVGD
jgi:hypothetical protein